MDTKVHKFPEHLHAKLRRRIGYETPKYLEYEINIFTRLQLVSAGYVLLTTAGSRNRMMGEIILGVEHNLFFSRDGQRVFCINIAEESNPTFTILPSSLHTVGFNGSFSEEDRKNLGEWLADDDVIYRASIRHARGFIHSR